MPTARDLRTATTRELRAHIVHGHPVDPHAIEGWAYRGTSLGLPSFVERIAWKTFQKTFWRDPRSGALRGWNVRLEQDGIDAPSRPKIKRGAPVCVWHYEVIEPAEAPKPQGFGRGLIIDYARADNPLGMVRFSKDPLVSLSPDSNDELLGVSYLVIGGRCVETPTYFTLEREHPIDFVPYEHAAPRALDPLRLTDLEKRWCEQLFAAILGTSGEPSLPPFSSPRSARFWEDFDTTSAPMVRAGLRPMLHTLVFLPVVSGFGKPFFALDAAAQALFLAKASTDPRYFVRQAMVTLKTLACLAYFDDPAVRDRFEAP